MIRVAFPLPLLVSMALMVWLSALVILLAWQRVAKCFVAVVALAMIWRGEAWRQAFLAEQAQLSLYQQRLPKTESSQRAASFDCAGLHFVSLDDEVRFRFATGRFVHCKLGFAPDYTVPVAVPSENDGVLPVSEDLGHVAYWVTWRPSLFDNPLNRMP